MLSSSQSQKVFGKGQNDQNRTPTPSLFSPSTLQEEEGEEEKDRYLEEGEEPDKNDKMAKLSDNETQSQKVVKKRQDVKNFPPSPTEEEVELLRFIDYLPEVLKSQYYKKKAEP
mgnify:CR=1 FL=1